MFVQTTVSTGEKFLCAIGSFESLSAALVRASNEVLAKVARCAVAQTVVHADGAEVQQIARAYKAGFEGKAEPVMGGTPRELELAYQAWREARSAADDGDA
jgi:hypothetical protein